MNKKGTLILGIGNLLMGDEGVGIHAVRRMEGDSFSPNVTLVDGGTGGFHLLSYLQEYDPIVMIDATMDGKPAGTITLLRPHFASDFPHTLSAHDVGLRDLVESASLLHPLPQIYLITVSIDSIQNMQMELSNHVAQSIPLVAALTRQVLDENANKLSQTAAGKTLMA
jgi:hydrogenase maturation protease